jgi:hypothetical protein
MSRSERGRGPRASKRSARERPRSALRRLLVLALLCGCASPGTATARFTAPYSRTAAAVERALAGHPIARRDVGAGRIETGWVERLSSRSQGIVLGEPWIERVRILAEIVPRGSETTEVRIAVHREERSPAGSRALRWHRAAPPAGMVERILDAVSRSLAVADEGEANTHAEESSDGP